MMEPVRKEPAVSPAPVVPVDQLPGEDSDYGAFRAFFTPDLIERQLLFTPEVRLPPAGEGRQPPVFEVGFVLSGRLTGNTLETGNTNCWDQGLTQHSVTVGPRVMVGIASSDFFPATRYEHALISPSLRPKAFAALLEILETDLGELKAIKVPEPMPFDLSKYI